MSTVSKLQIVLEATTTAFDRGLRKAQDGLNAFAKQTDKIHAKMESFQKRHQGAFDAMQAIGAASAVGLVAIGAGIKATTDEAMKFESAMAEVKKVVNFESPDGIKQMRAELEELSTRVPIAFDGLAKIAAAAGQSGIAANEIVKFTEAAAKMGTAFDITAEQAGQAMAEMRTAFKMSQAEVETLADKINYLGNNSPNAAAKIMEVVQRIGPLGEIAGVSADQIAAMAASLTSVEPDVAATGLKNMMLQLVKGESLSKSAKAAFDDLGLSYTEIAKGMQTDSIGTINKVFEAIKKLPEEAQAAKINDIFGSESIAVISQLINGTDTLVKHLQAMGDASKYAGSMSQEAANINDTSAAKMEMFKNATQNAKAAIGDAFLPALGALAEALLPVINGIKQFAQENPTMVTAITGIVGGVLVLGTALGAIGLAVPLVTTAFGGLTAIAGLVGTAIGAISLPVVAVVAAIAALVAAGVWLYNNWDMVKAKAIEVWNAIPEYASQAWQWIQGVWSGVGEWFGSIWDSVVSSVNTAWVAIKQAFDNWLSGMPSPVQEMVANIGSIFSGLVSVASAVWNGLLAVVKFVADGIVSLWQGFISIISGIWNGIANVATTVWNGIVSVIASVINAIKPIVSSVVSFFSSVWQGLVGITKSVWEGVKSAVSTAMTAIKAIFTTQLTVFASVFNAGFALVKNIFTTTLNVIKSLVRGDMNGVRQAFKDGFDRAVQIAKKAKDDIVGALRDLGKRLIQMGRDAIQGLINGMSEKIGAAVAKAQELAGKVIGAVKGAFDIHSPSRVMKALGGYAGEGFALGLGEKVKDAKQAAQDLANAVTSTISELHKNHFMLQNHANPLADLDYKLQFGELADLTDRQKERLRSLAKINLDIQKTNEATAKALQAQEQSAQNIAQANERSVQNYQSLQKQITLFGNNSKVAEFYYDIKHGKYDGVSDENLANERSALVRLEQINHAHTAKTAFEQMKGGLAGELSPLAKLQKELDERLTIIRNFEQAHTDVELEAEQARQQAEQAYLTAKNNLMLDNYSNLFNGISGMTKSFFGEQSGIYRAMFAMEKGMAIARSIMAIQTAIAQAAANPFPMNLGAMATVASQVGSIVSNIRAVQMPVGQAHDGIMSVPKSGTWNLEKGERVLPRHTAKALDDKLDGMGSGTVNNINVNVSVDGNGGDVTSNYAFGKRLGDAIRTTVQQELMREKRQGGVLYGI